MKNIICFIGTIVILILMTSCRTQVKGFPKVEDCLVLSNSIYCLDARLTNVKIDKMIQVVKSNDALSEEEKEQIVQYFEDNRTTIIEKKEFELELKYHNYFRGYSCTGPTDRNTLYQKAMEMAKKIEELEAELRYCR